MFVLALLPPGRIREISDSPHAHLVELETHEAMLTRGAETELVQDVVDVGLDGPVGQEQASRDLLVAQAFCDQFGDLALALAKRVEGGVVPDAARSCDLLPECQCYGPFPVEACSGFVSFGVALFAQRGFRLLGRPRPGNS